MFTTSLNNGDFVPVGSVRQLGAGSLNVPAGWLTCDGSAISRTLYKALFDVIGESYGPGDGSTTFNLPTQSAIISSIDDNVDVFGNNYALHLRNETQNVYLAPANDAGGGHQFYAYVTPGGTYPEVGNSTSGYSANATNGKFVGLSRSAKYSGISGTVTKSSVPYVFIIKY